MSIFVANSCEVSKLQINNSPSKMVYSFSKTERFPNISPYCSKHFYEGKEGISLHRGVGIGYGKRVDFEKIGIPINRQNTATSL